MGTMKILGKSRKKIHARHDDCQRKGCCRLTYTRQNGSKVHERFRDTFERTYFERI